MKHYFKTIVTICLFACFIQCSKPKVQQPVIVTKAENGVVLHFLFSKRIEVNKISLWAVMYPETEEEMVLYENNKIINTRELKLAQENIFYLKRFYTNVLYTVYIETNEGLSIHSFIILDRKKPEIKYSIYNWDEENIVVFNANMWNKTLNQ